MAGKYDYFIIDFGDPELLGTSMDKFGQFLEIAVDYMELDGDRAVDIFVNSGLSRCFELQMSPYVCGMSGTELVEWALQHCGRVDLADQVPFDATVGLSIPYWIGEMVAYFQAHSGMTYRRIFQCVPYERFRELYFAYNECVPEDFFDVIKRIVEEHPWESELKRRRKAWGMTQAQLAGRAMVSLRAIQQYEQGTKDIRKAAVDTVYRLSVALRCTVEDLI